MLTLTNEAGVVPREYTENGVVFLELKDEEALGPGLIVRVL